MLREELSLLISTELTDERLADAMVNVTDVVVSQDLRNARVYVEHALPPASTRSVLQALGHAHGYLRQSLARNLSLRYIPELTFHLDTSSERGRRIDELLNTIAHDAPPSPQP